MSDDSRPHAEMLAEFVSGPIPMERFLDKDEALAAYYAESRTRLVMLRAACSQLDQSGRAELADWLWELVGGMEKLIPPTSRYTRLDAAKDELRNRVEWLADLD